MTLTSHDPELLAAYALDALDADELRRVEAHLAEPCAACERELSGYSGLLERLASEVAPITPSASARARLLAAVAAAEPPGDRSAAPLAFEPRRPAASASAPRPRRDPLAWLAVAASLGALVLAGWGALGRGELARAVARSDAERERLASRLADTDAALVGARSELARLSSSLSFVAAPGNRAILLAGLEPVPEAAGKTIVNPVTGDAMFVASGLPQPAAGRTYQLWFITGSGAVSAGVFDVDRRGEGSLEVAGVPSAEEVLAWAVTLEPAGGMPQPTGAMVLKS